MNVSGTSSEWPALRNRIAYSVPGLPPQSVGNHLGRLAADLLGARPNIDISRSPSEQALRPMPPELLASAASSRNVDQVAEQFRNVWWRYAIEAEPGKLPFFAVNRLPEFCSETTLALVAANRTMQALSSAYLAHAADPVDTQEAVDKIVDAARLDALPHNVITAIENGHVFRYAPSPDNPMGEMVDPLMVALNKNWDMLYAQLPTPIRVSSVASITEAQFRALHDA